jgi:hypothetical protein
MTNRAGSQRVPNRRGLPQLMPNTIVEPRLTEVAMVV